MSRGLFTVGLRFKLMFAYFAISILTAVALWLQFKEDAPHAEDPRRRRDLHYD